MISSLFKYQNKKLIKKYSIEMPIQLKMRFKEQESFSRDQVAQVLRITQLGTGLLKNITREKYAYAMFCSENEFSNLFPKLNYKELRTEIIGVLFLNKNKKSLSLSCLLHSAGNLNSKYLNSLDSSASYSDSGYNDSNGGSSD